MSRPLSAAALVALFALTSGCVSNRSPSHDGVVLLWSPLSATAMEVEYSAGELPAYRRAFTALCRSAKLALDQGFPYLRIYDRERVGPGAARWKLQLLDAPPEGAVLLDVAEPTWEGDPPADGVLDADSFAGTCEQPSTGTDTQAPR